MLERFVTISKENLSLHGLSSKIPIKFFHKKPTVLQTLRIMKKFPNGKTPVTTDSRLNSIKLSGIY